MLVINLFISGTEIAFIVFVIVLIFGADQLPEITRGLARGMRVLKDATSEVKAEIMKNIEDPNLSSDLPNSVSKDVKKEIDSVKDEIEDIIGSVKRKL